MSFTFPDFPDSDLPPDQWFDPDNFASALSDATAITSKEPQPLDMSVMQNVLADRSTLSQYQNTDQYGRPWYDLSAHGTPLSQSAPYKFGDNGQFMEGENFGDAASMLQFQGNLMASDQRQLHVQQSPPMPRKKQAQSSKRRDRSQKPTRDGPALKRKKTAKAVPNEYLEGVPCGEECQSVNGSATSCCSSCNDGDLCDDPSCAIPCAEISCEQPICPADCPVPSAAQGQANHFQQGFIPSSERLSFLQQANAEPWNAIVSRRSPLLKEGQTQNTIDPALPDLDGNSQHGQGQPSSPLTPSMVQNMATPFSPEAAMQPPQFMNQVPEATYSNEQNTIVGTGGRFDWSDSLANTGLQPWIRDCGWYGCEELVPDEMSWWNHLHERHLDPQIIYPCPLQSDGCPSTLETNAWNHLQTQHGFQMSENFTCPAPTCSPAETFHDPAMFHNHLDQAHSSAASGSLYCRLQSCNESFLSPNQLISHINQSHPVSLAPPAKVTVDTLQASKLETSSYPSALPADEELVEHTCKWKLSSGGICGQSHGTEKDLQEHVKAKHLATLSKNTGYICQWENCNRPAKMGDKQGFSQRGKLERHMASHTNYKCCQCDVCKQWFSAEQAMKQHKLLHTGEKPWQCKVCGKCFPQQSACTIHERTHTGDKPLKCEICGKRFSESSNFAKHRRTHGEMGKHACDFPGCGKNFHRSDQLKKHVKTHEKQEKGRDRSSSECESDDVTNSGDVEVVGRD